MIVYQGENPISDILRMSDSTIVDPGGGDPRTTGGQIQLQNPPVHSSQVRPGHTFAGAAQAAGESVPGGRSWQKIFSDAKNKRNILEIHINKKENLTSDESQQKSLSNDELSDFLFKILKIKEEDTIGIDYFYGHKEIELKPDVDVTPYLHDNIPTKYMEFDIIVKQQETNFSTKILFRNVPLNVPDEELVNLALCYGQPVGTVKRERLTNPKDKGKIGSNRTLDVILNPGQSFENYYWLEGPLPSDQGRRIIVTHQNQSQQCSHCFGYTKAKYGTDLVICPGNGNGKACKALETERARMGPYMRVLQKVLGYRSLKAKFSRMGPMEEQSDDEESEVTVTYKSPIMEKDEKILTLQGEKEKLLQEKEQIEKKFPELKENLSKTKSNLTALQKKVKQKSHQISQATEITEKRLAEAISLEPSYLRDNPHLVTLLAVLQERDDFDVDAENGVIKPIHEDSFLKNTVDKVFTLSQEASEKSIEVELCKERIGDVKNQLLNSVKQRWIRSGRRDSFGSQASMGSKRGRDDEPPDERASRIRTPTPQKQ